MNTIEVQTHQVVTNQVVICPMIEDRSFVVGNKCETCHEVIN